MGKRVLIVIFVLFAGVAAGVSLLQQSGPRLVDESPSLAPAQNDGAVDSDPIAAATGASLAADDRTAPQSEPGREEVPASDGAEPGPLTRLRGRCVDANGQPLQGVRALLNASLDRRRAPAEANDPKQRSSFHADTHTDASGRFELAFWPPGAFTFSLSLRRDGLATQYQRWPELGPGATIELGDVVMLAGARVSGSVVDEAANAVAGARIHIRRSQSDSPGMRSITSHQAQSAADGRFEFRDAIQPGEYEVEVNQRELVSPKQFEVPESLGAPSLRIVLKSIDPSAVIRGVVVDEKAVPVAGASVVSYMSGASATTDAAGRFELIRLRGEDVETALSLTASGYDALQPPQQFRWGGDEVTLTMRKSIGLDLLVVRDADGTPVEEFEVRAFQIQAHSWSSRDSEPRAKGRHPGGRVVIKSLARGNYLLIVRPTAPALATSITTPVGISDSAAAQLTVRLGATCSRVVRVLRGDDSAVAGTAVQLVDPLGEPFHDQVCVHAVDEWFNTSGMQKALLLEERRTDDRGEVELHGAGSRSLALFVRGPGHAPFVVPVFDLDVREPLVVRVPSGATLELTAEPREAIADLRLLANLPPSGPLEELARNFAPAVRLFDAETKQGFPRQFPPPGVRACTFDEAGTVRLEGVPPGHWRIMTTVWIRDPARKGGGGGSTEQLGEITLREGETAKLTLDLSHLRVGQIEGLVLKNGAPVSEAAVQLLTPMGAPQRGGAIQRGVMATTDASGRFRAHAIRGSYRLTLGVGGTGSWRSLQAEGIAVVTPGATAQPTFTLQTAEVSFRLLDGDGKPISQVPLLLRDLNGGAGHTLSPTDGDGRVRAEIESRTFDVYVLRRRMLDPAAQQKLWAASAGKSDPLAEHRIRLGAVHAREGERNELTLRLPPEWYQ